VKSEAREKTIELLRLVGIPSPEIRLHDYPLKLSGGMRQRVMIAMALACKPKLIIADEPTTALDVTIQAQILDLLNELRRETHTSLILITHDMGVIAESTDSVAVMYTGKIVEYASVEEIFNNACHPYTIALLNSIPQVGERVNRLNAIPGMVPNPLEIPSGCAFKERCSLKTDRCDNAPPKTFLNERHYVRCWMFG
jgi:peptide/nickel transport system ATP-binding protein